MTTLILARHAKSDWGNPGLDDHDRPLNDRGRRDAPVLAERLAARGLGIQALLSSTALRARETAGFFGAALELEPELDPNLYGAPARTLLGAASARGLDAVMVVAHDPGMTVLAERLSGGAIAHMPTCAVAIFQWNDSGWDLPGSVDPDAWDFDAPSR